MEKVALYFQKGSGFLFLSLCFVAILISFLIAKIGMMVGIVLIIVLIGFSVLVITLNDFRTGFLLLVAYAYFLFPLGRLIPFEFPLGVFIEILTALIFVAILTQNYKSNKGAGFEVFKNPIGYALLGFLVFTFLELINPNSTSIMGRVVGVRETLAIILLFYVVMHVFSSLNYILFFTKFWLFFAMLAALYGMYQEYVGLQEWELKWLYSNPEGAKLAVIWGHVRKWSFLSDINAFGLFMAYAGIVCALLSLGNFSLRNRVILGASAIIMFVSGSYSGTRTATAMIVVGFVFYILMTINKRNTILFAFAGVIALLAILYGPFYGSTFSRIRSTFKPNEDASMYVRDEKRLRLQPYARTHPIGGGLNTVGNLGMRFDPGHQLAGPYDADSGFLRIALERGWVGLFVNLALYATVLIWGAYNYYRVRSEKIKIIYAAYMAAFYAMSMAHFTQDSMDQKPALLILVSTYAFIARLITFDNDGAMENNLLKEKF